MILFPDLKEPGICTWIYTNLKVRTFTELLNKYIGIIIILVFLGTILISLKLAYGQLDNLTVNQTSSLENQTEAYDSVLMGIIKNANITIPSDLHPTIQQLEQITDEIVNGGHPYKVLDEIRQNKTNS
jgi:hypothetical protein